MCRKAPGGGETPGANGADEAAYLVQSEKTATPRGRLGNQLDNSLNLQEWDRPLG